MIDALTLKLIAKLTAEQKRRILAVVRKQRDVRLHLNVGFTNPLIGTRGQLIQALKE